MSEKPKRPYIVLLAGNPMDVAPLWSAIDETLPLDRDKVVLSRNAGGLFGACGLAWVEGEMTATQQYLGAMVGEMSRELVTRISNGTIADGWREWHHNYKHASKAGLYLPVRMFDEGGE